MNSDSQFTPALMELPIAVVGLGLIGGSLALALREAGVVDRIIGIDSNSETCDKALAMGMVDACCHSIADLPEVGLLVLASPVNSFQSLAEECYQHLPPTTTISDVGSTKTNLLEAFACAYGELPAQLAPAHPIAGSERSGIDASDASLFRNANLILVPTPATGKEHYQLVRQLWQKLESNLVEMSSEYHDLVLAKTSHLPHILSFAMVYYLAHESENYDIFHFAGAGFRDLTRMAGSDPIMWSSIFHANKKNMLPVIEGLQDTLNDLKNMIASDDLEQMNDYITKAREARRHFMKTR